VINALPGNSSVKTIQHATIDEVVVSVSSPPSGGGTTGLCNPLLGNGTVNTFPCIGPCCESGDVIYNRGGVFRGGLCKVHMREVNAEGSSVRGS
jgi:hypothetical protein